MVSNVDFAEQSYRESVETLERLCSSKVFSNGAPIHAAIIFDSFFRHSRRSVKIFCKTLASEVFNAPWLVEQAARALARGVGISVIVQEVAEKSLFRDWLATQSGCPGVSFQEDVAKRNTHAKTLNCNFAIMDSRAYRFEADASQIKAVACMHDTALGTQLEGIFARLA